MKLESGRYRHFKRGDLYLVHRVVRNATNAGGYSAMVYYEAVDKTKCKPNDDGVQADIGHFVRSIEEFTEVVEWPDGVRRPRWVKEA